MHRRLVRASALLLALTLVGVTALACGSSMTEELAAAVPPTATTGAVQVESTAAPTAKAGPTATPKPTDIPPSPTPEPQALAITAQGFGQDERQVGFAFIVENPNPGLAIEDTQYQVAAYDADDVVLETDSGYIDLLLPGQRLGVAGTIYLDEGVTAAKIEVQLSAGDSTPSAAIPTFTVDKLLYAPGDYFSNVTGVITSPYDRDLTMLRVSAVAYNSAGDIIGGGFTYLNFILAQGTTGARVPLTSARDVASVELYPSVSGLSLLGPADKPPTGATGLVLAKQGFGQDGSQVGVGMLIENPNEAFSVENSQYHLTAYAEDGTVLAVEEGYVNVLLPKQTLGVARSMYLEGQEPVARMDFQVKAGEYEKSEPLPFFTAEKATYQGSAYSAKVTGHIVSPYAKDISNLIVAAIAYDEAGEIIGGGFTFLEFVPANGKAAVEVLVTTAGAPAAVELYASVSALSDFK